MKNSMLILSLVCILLFGGCEKNDDFSCDKQVEMRISGERECANARTMFYRHYISQNTTIIEEIEIEVLRSGGPFRLKVFLSASSENTTTLTPLISENVRYEYVEEQASYWFQHIQQTYSGYIILTKFDRTAKLVSGTYDFRVQSGRGDSDSSGKFTNVSFE